MDPFQLIQKAQLIDPDFRPTKKDLVLAEAGASSVRTLSLDLSLSGSPDVTVFITKAPETGMFLGVILLEVLAGGASGGNLAIEFVHTSINGVTRCPFEGSVTYISNIVVDSAEQIAALCRPFRAIGGTDISLRYYGGGWVGSQTFKIDAAVQRI